MDPDTSNFILGKVDSKSDVWSLGAIIYVLVAGTTTNDPASNKLYFDFNERIWHEVSENLHDFLVNALFLQKRDRWSVDELLESPFIERAKEQTLKQRRFDATQRDRDGGILLQFNMAHAIVELLHFYYTN